MGSLCLCNFFFTIFVNWSNLLAELTLVYLVASLWEKLLPPKHWIHSMVWGRYGGQEWIHQCWHFPCWRLHMLLIVLAWICTEFFSKSNRKPHLARGKKKRKKNWHVPQADGGTLAANKSSQLAISIVLRLLPFTSRFSLCYFGLNVLPDIRQDKLTAWWNQF